jgi:calcineurin-like phosphoesterase family protein
METKSKTFFTSDTHWGHKNIIKYSNRPYANVDEMNEALIDNWNSVVQPDDLIYHLGDFAFLEANKLENVLRRLNGRKRLIWGNHDQTLQNNKALQQKYFEWCKDMYEFKEVVDNEVRHFVLCHYAMLVWNKSHRGAFMLHGHSHGSLKYPFPAKIMDVGVDPQGYFPISIEEVTKRLSKIESQVIDHHGDPTKPDNESKGLQPSDQVNR